MIIENKILGLLGLSAKAGKIAFGAEAATECIKRKKAYLVIIADDCSERTKRNFEFLCSSNNTPIIKFGSIEKISKAIGKKNKAIICIRDKNLADEVYRIYGGDFIG